jgi:trehalose 6-phosphate synthase
LFEEISILNQSMGGKPDCILVSNRGPIEYSMEPDGRFIIRNSPGGVVTGLLGAIQQYHTVWISLTTSEGKPQTVHTDKLISNSLLTPLANVTLHHVNVSRKTYNRYYNRISNHILWFAQHSLLQPVGGTTFDKRTQADWEQGYSIVNNVVAKAVIEDLKLYGSDIPVIFQDYHLYLVPEQVRAQYPKARLSHVISVPWPDARYLALLPDYIVQAIYRSLAANDIIGFQTLHDAQNFLRGAEYFLKNVHIHSDIENPVGSLFWQKRRVQVRLYPIAISPKYLQAIAESKEAEAAIEELSPQIRFNDKHQIILRVDRVEPTKNIIRGFQAYEHLLQSHPEMHGKVVFLSLLVPSRQSLTEYRSYERNTKRIIDHINIHYGRPEWQPIIALFGNDRTRALACLQYYDVLLVNPVIDGMNLVVKEGGIVNKRAGVIVLSRTAGAHDILGDHVLNIAPTDIDATADALYRGLTMSVEERTDRACKVREILLTEDAAQSMDIQIDNLLQIKLLDRVLED